MIGIILQYMEELPPAAKAAYGEYLEVDYIESLRVIHRALLEVKVGTLPGQLDLNCISHSELIFQELADGLRSVAACAEVSVEVRSFIDTGIADHLDDLAKNFLVSPSNRHAIREWARSLNSPPKASLSGNGPEC